MIAHDFMGESEKPLVKPASEFDVIMRQLRVMERNHDKKMECIGEQLYALSIRINRVSNRLNGRLK